MTHQQIREKFRKFFESKGHTWVESSSLLPSDPSVLLTTAGMQQFKRYFTGELDPVKDFGSKNTTSIQKAFRTSDIDEVGDETHLTFFEMLGHFSFGDYFKKETIAWTYELLTDVFGISPERISASVFEGDEIIPFDEESFEAWSKLLPTTRIRKGPRADNVWGPAGTEGPCGACNEVYVDDVEVATLVFMEYYSQADKKLTKLTQKGVDVGWGFERIVTKLQEKNNIFETDLFRLLMEFLSSELPERVRRIIVDHARGTTFLLTDGVSPSNKEAGYILRRLLRRIFVYAHIYKLKPDTLEELMKIVFDKYGEIYPELLKNRDQTINSMWAEYQKFNKTVGQGLKELEKLEVIDASSAFTLYESFGLPYEIVKEMGGDKAKNLTRESFDMEFKRHQEISRAGVEKKFGSHGIKEGDLTADNAEEMKKIIRLHTATHVVVAALEKVLGEPLKQAGADINAERLRFDFAFPRKVTPEEIQQAEKIANKAVADDLEVWFEELPLEEAFSSGAHGAFAHKYPPRVKVYTIGGYPPHSISSGPPFSREICGGPHVTHTGEVGHIKIIKEESISGGNRRIRAVIE